MLLFWKMGIGIKHFNFFSSIWSVCKNNSNRMGMIIEQRRSLGFGLNRLWVSHCMRLRLSQISVCDSRWPQAHSSHPASVFMHCSYRREPQCPLLVCGFETVLLCMSSILKFKTSLTIAWILMGLITAHLCVLGPVAQPVWASVPSCWVLQCPLCDLVRSIAKWGAHVQSVLPNVSLLEYSAVAH